MMPNLCLFQWKNKEKIVEKKLAKTRIIQKHVNRFGAHLPNKKNYELIKVEYKADSYQLYLLLYVVLAAHSDPRPWHYHLVSSYDPHLCYDARTTAFAIVVVYAVAVHQCRPDALHLRCAWHVQCDLLHSYR